MMSELRSKYKEQLGMNVGTAQNRLVKDLLFKFIVDMDLDYCYQCQERLSREDFSIEHKVPWRNATNADDLFFDLDNIAFSHNSCNCKAARRTTCQGLTDDEKRIRKNTLAKARRDAYLLKQTPEEREAELSLRRARYAAKKLDSNS